jgi:hypothetical protein
MKKILHGGQRFRFRSSSIRFHNSLISGRGFVAIFDDVLKTPFGYQAYWGNSFRVESLVPAPWSLLRQVSRCAKSLFGEAGADSAGEKDPGRKEDGFAICLLCPNSESQSKCHNVP